MASPQRTPEILDHLQSLGFNDEAFWRLHHFRLKGDRDTIQAHREYLEKQIAKGASLRDGDSNEEVQRRLALVLAAYEKGGFASHNPDVFAWLAEAAFVEVSCRRAV